MAPRLAEAFFAASKGFFTGFAQALGCAGFHDAPAVGAKRLVLVDEVPKAQVQHMSTMILKRDSVCSHNYRGELDRGLPALLFLGGRT